MTKHTGSSTGHPSAGYEFISIELPPINGILSVGLSAAAEEEIVEAEKLQVVIMPTLAESITITLFNLAAAERLAKTPASMRAFLIRAAYVAMASGAVCYDVKGEWESKCRVLKSKDILLGGYAEAEAVDALEAEISKLPEGTEQVVREAKATALVAARKALGEARTEFAKSINAEINAALEVSLVKKVGTLLCATKVNWYRENHHCGTGAYRETNTNYVTKVGKALFPDIADVWPHLYRVSHWISTLYVLSALGMKGLKGTKRIIDEEPLIKLQSAADLELRLKSNPAGTARTNIAHAIWKRIVAQPVAMFCPNLSDAATVNALKASSDELGPRAHTGSAYLTGHPRNFDDMAAVPFLGRAYAFGASNLGGTTLMKSPHMSESSGRGYDDYSIEFVSAMNAFKMASADMLKNLDLRFDITNVADSMKKAARVFGVSPSGVALSSIVTSINEHNARLEADQQAGKRIGERPKQVPDID